MACDITEQSEMGPCPELSSARTPRFGLSLLPQAAHEEAGARLACSLSPRHNFTRIVTFWIKEFFLPPPPMVLVLRLRLTM